MISTLKILLNRLKTWFEQDIPDRRLSNDRQGRRWFTKSFKYDRSFKLEDLREITDRKTLNEEYRDRYREEDIKKRKGISAIKTEISALYGFNKCFVQRYKGRMHFYRDDLSQKGARNLVEVGLSAGVFEELKKNLSA